MFNNSNIYGVILAGGSGSRLWPLSREQYPKQLLNLGNENTLFQSTFLRLSGVVPHKNVLTVTNIKHSPNIKLQLEKIKTLFSDDNDYKVLSEPIGRNTAPAIALSIFYILKEITNRNEDPILIVTPSDHLIKDIDSFRNALKEGISLAEAGYIVTFGIEPNKPDTGYGYISTDKSDSLSKIAQNGLEVKAFKEKPDIETARKYLEEGTYFWNGGIFMFKASTMLKELEKFSPDIVNGLKNITINKNGPTISFDDYEKLQDISIDYAVMEHSDRIALIPINCGWNDLGSWEAIFDVADKDENNNNIVGNVVDFGSKNSLIYSTSKLVTTIGLKDTVVVETDDAILVCDKNQTQDVKKVFEDLKKNNNLACFCHQTVYRPWGFYTNLQRGEGFLTKCIQVNPHSRLSLQLHNHRSEHWVVLEGKARVTVDNSVFNLKAGDSIDIPVKTKHRLENTGSDNLKILEVQKGDNIDEEDIIRFDDIYGRVSY